MDVSSEIKENHQEKEILNSQQALRIGELLVKEGFLQQKEVDMALSVQSRELELSEYPLGHILVKNRALSVSDLKLLLKHPELKRGIGLLAVEKGLITKDQREYCLRSKAHGQRTGEFLMNEGLLTPEDIKMLLREQINAPRLGN